MGLVRGTDAQGDAGDVHCALGAEAAPGQPAGVHQGPGLQAPGVWVTSGASPTHAGVGANLVLAHSIGATRVTETLILVRDTLGVGVSDEVDWTRALLDVVDHLALGIDSTSILFLTQVDTGSSDTALVRLTVPVDSALDLLTLHLGVTLESLGTEAHCSVIGHPTLGTWSTATIGQTAGVPTLTLGTHLLVTTVSVQQTSWLTHSSLTQMTLGTRDVATALLSTCATNTGLATGAVLGHGALLDADSVLARVASVAVSCLAAGIGQWEAASEGVTSRGWGTGAECLVIVDRALCACATLRVEAGILTLGVDAGLSLAALSVRGAASHAESLLADVSRVTILIAVTQRSAGALDTHLISQTVLIAGGAGGGTLTSNALEPRSTLATGSTLLDRMATGSQGVSSEARGAATLGLVIEHCTLGITATTGHTPGAAGVSALVVDAGLVLGTGGG